MLMKSQGRESFLKSVSHAIDGFIFVLKKERNIKIQLLIGLLVLVCGIFFHISFLEWIVCLLLIAFILVLELINTAFEKLLDFVKKDYDENIKHIKDISASMVLVMTVFASIIGLMIFVPNVLGYLEGLR